MFKNMCSLSLGTGTDNEGSARIQEEEKCECFQPYIAGDVMNSKESVGRQCV